MANVAKRTWTHKGVQKTAWTVRYREGVTHRQRTFERKKDAETYCRKVEAEIEGGTHVAWSETRTVAELCDEFMLHQETRIKDGRIGKGARVYLDNATRVHIKPRVGHVRVTELTPVHIDGMYRDMITRGGLMPKTARTRIAVLKRVYEFGRRRKLVKANPVVEALEDLRGIEPANIRTFNVDDIKALFAALEVRKHKGHRRAHLFLRCAVYLASLCGLRFGEIGGLTIEHVDVDRSMIRIRHNLTRYDELKGPKTKAGNRDVPMPDLVARLVGEWLREFYIPNERGLIFRTRTGGIINTNSFHFTSWGPLLAQAGLNKGGDNLHFHALRHFAGSWMVENGWSLPDVATALGHSKFDTTLQTYVHSIRPTGARLDRVQAMADRLMEDASAPALPAPIAA